ncbi:hypothetical protein [Helicobacter sp. MIT 01-3238]|uniref:hypothetical protein n=1 Tax=Helicobacter sp. MIT 01-3238 TaxID=398627 RepID=UPI000E1E5817|nr:hypothetical protein [Helicobacter sp. MIT 01-3238]RDU53374.1 hypothetical protein CQA40_05315 [Helicobacter sp. MIT 01-3238]
MAKQAKRSFFSNDESFHAFANAKDTHPQTPPQREGALRESNAITLREEAFVLLTHKVASALTLREGVSRSFPVNKTICHTEGVARSISRNISKDSANNTKQKKRYFACLNMTTHKSVDY